MPGNHRIVLKSCYFYWNCKIALSTHRYGMMSTGNTWADSPSKTAPREVWGAPCVGTDQERIGSKGLHRWRLRLYDSYMLHIWMTSWVS